MLLILLNWLWMAVSFFAAGFAVCRRILFRRRPAEDLKPDEVLVTGIISTALFAQAFSFFAGVGTAAYIAHVVLTAVLLWTERKALFPYLRERFSRISPGGWIGAAAVCAGFACLTAMPTRLYDDYLYHIQIVRWIQEYGIVKGVGNLHTRLAFMSSSFFPQALYSWAQTGLAGDGIYGFTGFCACAFFLLCGGNAVRFIASRIRGEKTGGVPAFALSLAGLLYFVYIKFGVAGLSTDLCPNLLTIYIFMKWLGMAGKAAREPNRETAGEPDRETAGKPDRETAGELDRETAGEPNRKTAGELDRETAGELDRETAEEPDGKAAAGQYRFIALCSGFAMTLNISAAILVLLSLYPICRALARKAYGQAFALAACCAVPVIPMVIRSLLISGYLIWPSGMLSVWDFPWKIPREVMAAYREQVTAWARMVSTLPEGAEAGRFTVWFPNWFRQAGIDTKALTVLSFGAVAASLPLLVIRIRKKQFGMKDWALIVSEIAFLFWLWNAPNPRFNQSVTWVLLIAFVNVLGIRAPFEIKPALWKALAAACALAVPLGGFALFRMARGSEALEFKASYLLRPAGFTQEWPYEELRVANRDGTAEAVLYINSDPEEDRLGYSAFPAVPPYHGNIILLGTTLRDGFAPAQ